MPCPVCNDQKEPDMSRVFRSVIKVAGKKVS